MSEEIKNEDELAEKPLEVIIKKEETKPDPDFDYDSDQLSDKEIQELETEITSITKKRVNQDSI